MGRLQPPATLQRPYADHVAEFADYLLRERGLSPRTVAYSLSGRFTEFLAQIDEAGLQLKTLTVAQVDELLAKKVRDEGYARVTIQSVGIDPPSRSSGSRKDAAGAARGWRPRSWPRGSSPTKACRSARPGTT